MRSYYSLINEDLHVLGDLYKNRRLRRVGSGDAKEMFMGRKACVVSRAFLVFKVDDLLSEM